jgi:hypothetical protein
MEISPEISQSVPRTAHCLSKLRRMTQALHHQEPDRVPISDFFWSSFLER